MTGVLGVVAQGVNVGLAGAQAGIHHDAALALQACRLCQCRVGAQADGAQHQVGLQTLAVGQRDEHGAGGGLVDRCHGGAKVPLHTQACQGSLKLGAGLGWQQRRDRCGRGIDQLHRVPGAGKVIGKFAADQPGAHDQYPGLGRLGRTLSQQSGVEG